MHLDNSACNLASINLLKFLDDKPKMPALANWMKLSRDAKDPAKLGPDVQKTAEDLVLPTGPGGFAPDSTFTVAAVSVGYIREVVRMSKATLGVGFQTTLNLVPTELQPFYGSRTPVGGMVFVRFRPLHGPHATSSAMMRDGAVMH